METKPEETKPVETKTVEAQPVEIKRVETKRVETRPAVSQNYIKARKITYYILGVLETLFAFRLVFKILGANPQSAFVDVIYSITNIFLAPFKGIFRSAVANGIETEAVLEPELLIAIASYAVLVWGIIKLIELIGKQNETY
jgi:hypothetical protein